MRVAYNRRNLLNKIIEIQNITLELKKLGVTQKRIFKDHIEKRYHISRSTYYEYLGTSAKLQLKKLELNDKQQLQLF